MVYHLRVILKSGATFGSGKGVPGLIDQEVQYDQTTGLPEISGTVLKGLLVETCAEIMFKLSCYGHFYEPFDEARFLFGQPGSQFEDTAQMNIGTARFPSELVEIIRFEIMQNQLSPLQVLSSLTAIRKQTGCDEFGTPTEPSLRSSQVVLRNTILYAPIEFSGEPTTEALTLLGACAMATRHGGTGRTRGRGWLDLGLCINHEIYLSSLANFRRQLENPQ